jgi:acyl-coenzyme A synthetase/AMP-(fatty) acid ligase
MVPEAFKFVERLPRSSTGKIARTELESATRRERSNR